MDHKKTISILFITLLLGINLISATKISKSTPEEAYDSTYKYYTENLTALTPRVLGRIEYQLKQIIANNTTSQETLVNIACLLFTLECTPTYTKVCNALFHRPDFNPKLYKDFIKRIRQLETKKHQKNNL